MSDIEQNRKRLRERIEQSGYVGATDWSHRQPIVSAQEYFANGVNEKAIDNWRILRFGIRAFAELLESIEKRLDVSAVGVEIDDDFEDGWPHCDYIFIATKCDADEIARWFKDIKPDDILPAGRNGPYVRARVIRIEDLAIAPGHKLWALRWRGGMSYDLMVFNPSAAPREPEAFSKWFEAQTEWSEEHSYDDPAVTTPKLATWYADMRRDFPNMNGPDAYDINANEDNLRVTGYTIGQSLIYADFRWSDAGNALTAVLERAVKHGVGFFNASVQNAEPWFPSEKPDTTTFHGLTLELFRLGNFKSPSAALIEAGVDLVAPLGGADFMILENPSGSYAQARGGPDEWEAEWREYSGETFRHWAAQALPPAVKLKNADIKGIMVAFAYGKEKPAELDWKDITEQFNDATPEIQGTALKSPPAKPWWKFW